MRVAPLLLPLSILVALATPALAQQAPRPGTIAMQGHGETTAAPDTAFITSGVTTQAATAREALTANTAAMGELIAVLKAAGIAGRDVQTSNFSVNPNYVYSSEADANGYTRPPRIDGYVVSNSVTIRVRDLPALGTVLDKAVTVGANTINGISFAVADPSELYDAARKLALADATHKAELYSDAAGVGLDNIVSIAEGQGFVPPQPYAAKTMAMEASAPVPVEAGELTFSIDVDVVWDLGSAD